MNVFETQEVFMNPTMTQAELVQALEARQNELNTFFSSISEQDFLADMAPKWNPAQHLIHLTKSGSRIAQGLQARDQLPNHETQVSRGYEAIRDTYIATLKQAPAELLAKVGASIRVEADSSQAQIVKAYIQAGTNLREAAQTWSETELDAKAMPHPVLGSISIREMLEFVVYHELHHLNGVRSTLS
jgi:hypothetical protein